MEKREQQKPKDPNLVALMETGRCNIPIATGQGEHSFVELLDQARAYANEMAAQLGIKISSNVRWFEETGHCLEVWDAELSFKEPE